APQMVDGIQDRQQRTGVRMLLRLGGTVRARWAADGERRGGGREVCMIGEATQPPGELFRLLHQLPYLRRTRWIRGTVRTRAGECASNSLDELGRADGLQQEVLRAEPHCVNRGLERRMSRQQQHSWR